MRWLTSTPIEALRTNGAADIERSQSEGDRHPIEPPLDELPDPGPAFDGSHGGRCTPDGFHGSGLGARHSAGGWDEGRIPRLRRVDRV
jgi:hypothetical protein